MNIRQFKPDDAESCFRLRSNAFIQKFHNELIIDFGGVFAYIDMQNVRVKEKMSEQYPECLLVYSARNHHGKNMPRYLRLRNEII